MARSYARYTTSIWHDDNFVALTPEQQAMYFLLDGQAEVTACGTLPLRPRRWSRMARSWTPERVTEVLGELAERGHVVIDEDTEELLIRKFVKWDGGYTNSKRLPVIRESAMDIASPILRRALAREFAKLGLSDMASDLGWNSAWDTAWHSPSDTASDSTTAEDRVVVKKGDYIPQPTTPKPQPATHNPQAVAVPDGQTADAPTAQHIVAEWIEHCDKRPPGRVVGQVAKLTGEMLSEGIDPDDIRRGIAAWMTKPLSPAVLPSVVNEVMNGPSGTARRPAKRTTDDKVRDGLALARRLAAVPDQPQRPELGA